MSWTTIGTIAAVSGALAVVIPYLVKLFVGPVIDDKLDKLATRFDSRFKHLEERIDGHIDSHSRMRR